MSLLIPRVKPITTLKTTFKVRGRLAKESDKWLCLAVCLDRCEKCPPEHFLTFFKGEYWKTEEPLKIGQMYELVLGVNKRYLNPIAIKPSNFRSCSNFGYVRGTIKGYDSDRGIGTVFILDNGIEIVNPSDKYDMEELAKNQTTEMLWAVQIHRVANGKSYISNGIEREGYTTMLGLYGKELKEVPEESEEQDPDAIYV